MNAFVSLRRSSSSLVRRGPRAPTACFWLPHVLIHADQMRGEYLSCAQLDLKLAFVALRALRKKYPESTNGPVNHPRISWRQVAASARGKVMIKMTSGASSVRRVRRFPAPAAARKQCRIRALALGLNKPPACAPRQFQPAKQFLQLSLWSLSPKSMLTRTAASGGCPVRLLVRAPAGQMLRRRGAVAALFGSVFVRNIDRACRNDGGNSVLVNHA